MAGKKGGENSKKAAGQARKADAAAQKSAKADAARDAQEAESWKKGGKDSSKKEAEAAKKAELAQKKAERKALEEEDERSTPGRSAPKNSKAAVKKTRGIDLAQLDDDAPLAALNASGIDNALDAMSLAHGGGADAKIDRHPERRVKAARLAYEKKCLAEMEKDGSGQGLRLNQKRDKIWKDFEKSPENPFNQVTASYDASKEDLAQIKAQEKTKIETRLGQR